MAAQHIGGLWYIWIKTDAARQHLLTKVITISFKSRKIELHDNNPFTSPRTPSEKIIMKDLPPHIPSDDIIEFLEQKHPHILTRYGAILARIPSCTNTLTEYYMVVYAKEGFFPMLPKMGCCCLPTPMALASGGESDVPDCGPPASFSVHLASSAVRRGLSTNPGATMWCVCGCS